MSGRRHVSSRVLFLVFSACFVALAVGYVVRARVVDERRAAALSGAAEADAPPASLDMLGTSAGLLFSSSAFDRTNGYLGFESMPSTGTRHRTAMRCERVHFAGGTGICLSVDRGVIAVAAAQIFSSDFRVRHMVPLAGLPSRARVSPDGRRAATTAFVNGDSYNSAGFSTRTTIIDTATGRVLGDLEEFAVFRSGARFKAVDFNFWGVTFAQDGNRFFATLRTGGTNYLVEGDVDARTARVLREDVECPSLSPDNTRIVFKSRTSPSTWRLHLLDLSTLRDTPLGETRSVDDQPEWLDNQSIAYMLPSANPGKGGSDIWTLSITTGAPPRLLLEHAFSPAVVRPPT